MANKYFIASILSFLIILLGAKPALAATYYVATTGNDNNSGTLNQPFLTIQKGLNSVTQAGDTLYIRAGTYGIGKTDFLNKTGSASQNIVISGYENERPKLDASGKIAGLWDHFINLSNLKYVSIKNLEFANSRGRAIYLHASDFVTFQNIWVHDTALAAIWSENSRNLIIENSKFWLNNKVNDTTGPWYRSNNWMGTLVARGPDSTTLPYAENITIRKNELFQGFGEGINIHGRASNVIIEDNVIYDFWAPAIYFLNSKNILVQRNLVYHTNDSRFLRGGNPGAAIGSQKEGPPARPGELKNIKIINNAVKGFKSNFFFWSYMGGYLTDTLIAHNTFINAHSNSGEATNINIGAGPHLNTKFENNIILQDSTTGGLGSSDGSIQFSNNLWSKAPPSNMQGSGDIIADPKIAKTGHTTAGLLRPDYFKLTADSPAIDKGKLVSVTEDYFKNTRTTPDIGAHEFTGNVRSTPSSAKSADANSDNKVDGFDYVIWLAHYNQAASGSADGDFNGNGKTDGADYIIWLNNYSQRV